jgi:hypothetical protein
MENRITAGVVVEHGGTRWRIERPLGADAVLLRNDAGEIVSTSRLRSDFPRTRRASRRHGESMSFITQMWNGPRPRSGKRC